MSDNAITPPRKEPKKSDYQRWFSFLLGIILILVAIVAGAIILIANLANRPVENHYFSVDNHGRLKELVNLGKPNMEHSGIKTFLTDAMTESYDFNFKNMTRRITKACDEYYTEKGCMEYKVAHKKIGNLDRIENEKLIVSAVPTGVPVVVKSGMDDQTGLYRWVVNIPMMITYTGSHDVTTKVLFQVNIVRSTAYKNEHGVAIDSHVYKRLKG